MSSTKYVYYVYKFIALIFWLSNEKTTIFESFEILNVITYVNEL
jgi:hypothetical protein